MNLKLFFRYLLKGFFDARFEQTYTKRLLNVSVMEILFALIFVSANREFGDILPLDFSVTTDFIAWQVFLRFF